MDQGRGENISTKSSLGLAGGHTSPRTPVLVRNVREGSIDSQNGVAPPSSQRALCWRSACDWGFDLGPKQVLTPVLRSSTWNFCVPSLLI